MRDSHYSQTVSALTRDPIVQGMLDDLHSGVNLGEWDVIVQACEEYRRRGGTLPGHIGAVAEALTILREQRNQYAATIARATDEGRDAGSAAGSWVVDPGRTSTPDHEYATGILGMLDDGTLDAPDPLSGEWADGILPRDVLSLLDVDEDDPAVDEYLSAFEDGYRDAWRETVERDARALLDEG